VAENSNIAWMDLKWCTACKEKHPINEFGKDRSRGWHGKPRINPITGRPGPAPKPPIKGDKKQARRRINVEVRTGRRPHPNSLPCVDCGHEWSEGERRHEYDHYLGYDAEHHLEVESVCTTCHSKRDNPKNKQSHCIKGHAFTEKNTYIKSNGTRMCRECAKERDKTRRRPRGYWEKVNAKRRLNNGI